MQEDPLSCAHLTPVKLFVGQIPRIWKEEDVIDFFKNFGTISSAQIIKDTQGAPRGCAFVTFYSMTDADIAIEALNENFYLPGSATKFQLKWADGEDRRLDIPVDLAHATKLLVLNVPLHASDEYLRDLFSKCGTLRIFRVIREPNKARLYLKYTTKEQALFAIREFNRKSILPETKPIEVYFAEAFRKQVFQKPEELKEKIIFYEFITSDGKPYYLNSITEERQFTRPSGNMVEIRSQEEYIKFKMSQIQEGKARYVVVISGLPEDFNDEELRNLLAPSIPIMAFMAPELGKGFAVAKFEYENVAVELEGRLNDFQLRKDVRLKAHVELSDES